VQRSNGQNHSHNPSLKRLSLCSLLFPIEFHSAERDSIVGMASSTINPSYGPVTSTGTVTSWLPLNTAWSAPAECSTLFLSDVLSPHQLYLNDPKYPNVVVGAPSCLPPQISTWWYNTVSSIAPTVYSLGGYSFVCPSAYSTVFSTANSLTTTIGCCPSYVMNLMIDLFFLLVMLI
jgi:hypothetical protein